MKTDIVFPSGNEQELAEKGRLLGFDKLIFVYDSLSEVKRIKSEFEIDYGVLVQEKDKKKLTKKINQVRGKGFLVLVQAVDDSFDRFFLERTKGEMIFGLESVHKKDAIHYRRSGLDQVLCKITAEKNKTIVFDFRSFLDPLILGRVIQNIRFCKKYHVSVVLGTFARSVQEMKSAHDLTLFLSLLQQRFL